MVSVHIDISRDINYCNLEFLIGKILAFGFFEVAQQVDFEIDC